MAPARAFACGGAIPIVVLAALAVLHNAPWLTGAPLPIIGTASAVSYRVLAWAALPEAALLSALTIVGTRAARRGSFCDAARQLVGPVCLGMLALPAALGILCLVSEVQLSVLWRSGYPSPAATMLDLLVAAPIGVAWCLWLCAGLPTILARSIGFAEPPARLYVAWLWVVGVAGAMAGWPLVQAATRALGLGLGNWVAAGQAVLVLGSVVIGFSAVLACRGPLVACMPDAAAAQLDETT